MTEQPQPPPGWYPSGVHLRWWDGVAWTDHVRPAAGPVADAPLPQARAPYLPADEPYRLADERNVPLRRVVPKSPALAVLASFFVPGLGSLVNGDVPKALLIFVGWAFSWSLSAILIGIPGLFFFWIWGMLDGYRGARRWNARHGYLG